MTRRRGPPVGKRGRTPKQSRRLRKLRDELIVAQGGICPLCLRPIYRDFVPLTVKGLQFTPTLEHVWPWSVRKQDEGNVIAAHLRCNERKANRPPTGCELIWLAAANAGLG